MACFKVDAFRDLATFRREVAEFANYLKETPTADGCDEVFYPGEIEYRQELKRLRDGVSIEDRTWKKLQSLADQFGVKRT